MSRIRSMRIRLVASDARTRDEWSLPVIERELRAAGHDVRLHDDAVVDSAADEIVHCFGWSSAVSRADSGADGTWLMSPDALDEPADEDETQRVVAAAHGVVVRSRQEQQDVHRLGVPWFRTSVVPIVVDTDTYTRIGPMARRTDRFRMVSEVTGGDDGLDDVLVSLSGLDDVELVALEDPGHDGSSSAQGASRADDVRERARTLGVDDRVVVVAPDSPGERAWWLRSGHVAVAVPPRGGHRSFVAEAMACGLPVVATPVDSLADMVVHGVTGFHVPQNSPVSLSRAVRAVVEDDFTLEAYGMAGADRALSTFSSARVAHALAGVYQRTLVPVVATDSDDDEVPLQV